MDDETRQLWDGIDQMREPVKAYYESQGRLYEAICKYNGYPLLPTETQTSDGYILLGLLLQDKLDDIPDELYG